MRELPTIRALSKAHSTKLHKLWEGLGYYTRVRNMQKAARVILSEHGGRFPHQFEKVLDLPGIGRYTAGAICSIAFNQPYPVLDGNVIRVLTRVFGIAGNPRESRTNALLWELAEDLVRIAVTSPALLVPTRPDTLKSSGLCSNQAEAFQASHLNQALMELGALVCTARQPGCHICPIHRFCVARRDKRIEDLPALSSRAPAIRRRFVAFVLERQGWVLVRQRPAHGVNAHLWEFPNFELGDSDLRRAARKEFKALPGLEHFCSIKHNITRFRITVDVFRAPLHRRLALPPRLNGRWLTLDSLQDLPFSSAHKRILLKFGESLQRSVSN